jgi:hypothetical protein
MGFVLSLIGPLLKLPRWVYAVVAGIVLLGVLWAIHGHWEHEAHEAAVAEGVAKEKVRTDAGLMREAVDLASINTLQTALAQKNAESLARAKALTDAKATDAANRAALDKQYASTKAARDALLAMAKVPGKGACRIPPALTGALDGL